MISILAHRFDAPNQVRSDRITLLVVSLRHRRDDFPKPLTKQAEIQSRFEPLQYDLIHKDRKILAVDRAIYARLPEVVQAGLLDFLSRRNFAPTRVSELPEAAQNAVADDLRGTYPGQEIEDIGSRTFSSSFRTNFEVTPPPGIGGPTPGSFRIDPKELALTAPSLTLPTFPSVGPKKGKAELRLFIPGRDGETACLPLWDEMRPLMKIAEANYVKLAKESMRGIWNAIAQWSQANTGLGSEGVNYGALGEREKKLWRERSGVPESLLDGASLRPTGGGDLYVSVALPGNGTLTVSLPGVGR